MEATQKRYGLTVTACCLGYLLQAVVVNVSPILFITLKEQFMLSYSQLGLLVLANFITQLLCDIFFGSLIDRYGFRPFALASAVIAALGFLAFAASPALLPDGPYPGFFLSTLLFAGAGGLLEVLLSPIVNALPLPRQKKASLMGFVHSAYSWGQIIVVLVTTLMLMVLGAERWPFVFVFWCLAAVLVFVSFLKAPLEPGVPTEKQQNAKSIFLSRSFFLFMVVMIAGGAGELVIGQWASSFLEKGLGVTKAVGDIIGVCAFAAAMGIGRTLYSRLSHRLSLHTVIRGGQWILLVCYLVVGLAPGRVLPLLAIIISGLGVSMVWPGTLVVAAEHFPQAGTWMFAILAAGGDTGASFGPWLTGKLMDVCARVPQLVLWAQGLELSPEQMSMRIGILAGAVFPALGLLAHWRLRCKGEK